MSAEQILSTLAAHSVTVRLDERARLIADWAHVDDPATKDRLAKLINDSRPELYRHLGDPHVPRSQEEICRDYLERHAKGVDKNLWIYTGWRILDGVIGGIRPTGFVVVGARPGIGKTSFCLQWADAIASFSNRPVCFISCEMDYDELGERVVSQYAGVSPRHHTAANIRATAERRSPVYYYEGSTEFLHVVERIQRMRLLYKDLAAVFIDYLGLIDPPPGRYSSDTEKVGAISKGLRNLARDERVPIIALHQINRENEKLADKRPAKHQLRGSGQIEQDATHILLLHTEDPPEQETVKMEVHVAKNRGGKEGRVRLDFVRSLTTFNE